MSDLYRKNPITANGSYDLAVNMGDVYLFTLKGTFGGATVAMTILSNVDKSSFDSVTDGSWTAETEQTLIPSGSLVRLTVTNASGSTSIRTTFVPIS
jgi:hypothetical protein